MKNIYTSALACAAMLLAGTSMAQINGKGSHQPNNAYQSIRPYSGAIDLRGGSVPVNDDCTGAVNQNLAVGHSVTFTGNNTGATDNAGLGMSQVWETFTTTACSNLAISYCGTNPAFGNAFLAMFIGCPFTDYISATSYDQTTCPDGNVTLFYEGVPAGQYYYAVMNDPANGAVGPYTLTVAAAACPNPPANDECAGAISLTSGTSCNLTYFNTIGATETIAALSCNGYTSPNAKDVWFSFVATSTEQSIGVIGYNASDAVIELFSVSCDNLTSMGCADNSFPSAADESTTEVLDQTGLTVGTTYYFRVYDWGNNSITHNFAGCVTEGSSNNVGIAEQKNAPVLSIYPNPGTGNFNLQYTGVNGLGTIEVLDLTGRTVYSEQTQMVNGANHTMNLSKLAQGQYSLRLTVNGTRSQQNLMVR